MISVIKTDMGDKSTIEWIIASVGSPAYLLQTNTDYRLPDKINISLLLPTINTD